MVKKQARLQILTLVVRRGKELRMI